MPGERIYDRLCVGVHNRGARGCPIGVARGTIGGMGGQDVGFARRTASTLLRPDSVDASSDEPEAIEPPTSAGRYRIGAPIGRGSMGAVYRGHDPELSRAVAVKLLLHATHASRSRELHHEAQALARIEHPNVLPCYDVGTVRVGGKFVPYVVTELVDGCTLAEWIAEQRRTHTEIVDVFAGAARGLAAVHAAGLVHRDFKPSNVLLGRDGRVLVSDFGLAQPAATPKSDDEHTQRSDAERTASTTTIAGTLA